MIVLNSVIAVAAVAAGWATGWLWWHLRKRSWPAIAAAASAAGLGLLSGSWQVGLAVALAAWHGKRLRVIGLTGSVAAGKVRREGTG